MKRSLYNKLVDWKKSINRKPLLLKGARQVGKTYLLQEFGKNEFQNTFYLNFEKDKLPAKQRDLIEDYYGDIAKHSGKFNAMHIKRIWQSIPEQLAST